jgi:hypothetical protein
VERDFREKYKIVLWRSTALVYRFRHNQGEEKTNCQDLQAEHINMRVKLIVLIVLLSWRWGLPITLYPGAPPQYRSGVSQLPTSQPLKQGYIATLTQERCDRICSLSPDGLISWAVAFAPSIRIANLMSNNTFDYVVEHIEPEDPLVWPSEISGVLSALGDEEPLNGPSLLVKCGEG